MKKLALHWQILIGMFLGLIFGFIMLQVSWGVGFVENWINPVGTIFIKLLKLIAIPLILASLINRYFRSQGYFEIQEYWSKNDRYLCVHDRNCYFDRIDVGKRPSTR